MAKTRSQRLLQADVCVQGLPTHHAAPRARTTGVTKGLSNYSVEKTRAAGKPVKSPRRPRATSQSRISPLGVPSPIRARNLSTAVSKISVSSHILSPEVARSDGLEASGVAMAPQAQAQTTRASQALNISEIPGLQPSDGPPSILDQAYAHLINEEPRLETLIRQYPCNVFSSKGLSEVCDPFKSLSCGIMAQQVSGAAASAIKRKFIKLFFDDKEKDSFDEDLSFPTPQQVASCTVPFLRQAGLSERKAEYIQGLAQRFASGEMTAHKLLHATDEEILHQLTAVRGLGRWSVEMFACFGLKRLDIFSTGDLGVQRGLASFLGKDVSKLKVKGGGKWKYMSERDMLDYSQKFSPYRSIFMWYMWKVEGVNIAAVEQ